MPHTIETVHVIFKTHLDVGFTDYAHKVVEQYFTHFIPQAIDLAETMQNLHPDFPFRWTVGSWLVYEYLVRATPEQRRKMEAGIEAGYINWHALPFTTHTEFMTAGLFRAGLRLSQELDQRFGRKTIACKMTDVPGHTRAMIPLLAEAGIRFLHIGVNPVATVPDVPPLFEWRDPTTDTSIIVMYQSVYGASMQIADTSDVLSLVFTGDNHGPPPKKSVIETYEQLQLAYPDARCVGATLDDIARVILDKQVQLPVITAEIGDTWIHGIGSDPTKVREYRELMRLREIWLQEKTATEADLFPFDRQIMMIPEHTWGMDLKTHLDDYEHYTVDALAKARQSPTFATFEKSWHEQRGYVNMAINELPDLLKAEAAQGLVDSLPVQPDLIQFQKIEQAEFQFDGWTVRFDEQSGEIIGLENIQSGQVFADEAHPLATLIYECFSNSDYERFWSQYIRDQDKNDNHVWAKPDNLKPGMDVAEHQVWKPVIDGIFHRQDGDVDRLLLEAHFPSEAVAAPKQVYLEYGFRSDHEIDLAVYWFGKVANRLPEAYWLSFNPVVNDPQGWEIHKLGQWISPTDVISKGARTLHSFDQGVRCDGVEIDSLDAALVAPGQPALLDFHDRLPDLSQGMHFNLFNNVWGTNFTMWFDDDAVFRFRLKFR